MIADDKPGERPARSSAEGDAKSGDRVRVQTFVAVAPADAFAVFTEEIDQWWRHGPRYRIGGKHPGKLHLEAKPGGRIWEEYGIGKLHEIGTITTWDPPNRLVFEWRGINFAPGESTTVEIVFEPSGEGTRVTLEHRGFAALRDGHPVRHGKDAPTFTRDLGMWWAGLLTSLREHAISRSGP